MLGLAFRDGVMDRIHLRERRFDEQAYLFVLAGLEYSQSKLAVRRHLTGAELAEACRALALQRWGLMARIVLETWGLKSTADIGAAVFVLVDLGFLHAQPQDDVADFADVYDFATAFEREYPWQFAPVA